MTLEIFMLIGHGNFEISSEQNERGRKKNKKKKKKDSDKNNR